MSNHEEVWNHLHHEVVLLHGQWQTFITLWGESDERVQLLNKSATLFFSIVQETLVRDLFIGVSRLVDPVQIGGQQNLTLDLLLKDPRVVADQKLHAVTQEKIEAAKRAIQPIRAHRNKRLAHLDLSTKLVGAEAVLPPVTRRMVGDALRSLADVLNSVDHALNRNTTAFDHVFFAAGDARALIRCLEQAEKWREQERAVRLQRRQARSPA